MLNSQTDSSTAGWADPGALWMPPGEKIRLCIPFYFYFFTIKLCFEENLQLTVKVKSLTNSGCAFCICRRGELLNKLADLIEQNAALLASLETLGLVLNILISSAGNVVQ